mmetsp:Transcript_101719/g.180654  ORF Transcript_101719/g.180654 Transcript_101719/m.180654 type:complete len:258 (-) Transcript_101719:52-825(-)
MASGENYLKTWFKTQRDVEPTSPYIRKQREMAIQKSVIDKMKKMKAAERDYEQRLKEIAEKAPVSRYGYVDLPPHSVRIQQKVKAARGKMKEDQTKYKEWLDKKSVEHDQRIQQNSSNYFAALKEVREKNLERQKAYEKSKSTPALRKKPTTLTEEEIQKIWDEMLHPVWDKSIKERAEMEKQFMKWTEDLKKNTTCAIDHKFTGEMGEMKEALEAKLKTRRAQTLKHAMDTENEYWDWTKTLKTKHQCSIDQAWTV